jgi:hypothetical protein
MGERPHSRIWRWPVFIVIVSKAQILLPCGRGTRGGAPRLRLQWLSSLPTQGRDPWREELPGFLSASGRGTPPIWVLLRVLIGERLCNGTKMQRACHDSRSGEGLLWQSGQEPFGDEPIAFETTTLLCRVFRGGCDHQTAALPARATWHVRASRERADQLTFRAGEWLIGGQVQARLDRRHVKEPRVLAARHESQTQEISLHCSGPRPTVKSQQSALFGNRMRLQGGTNRLSCSSQLLAVLAVPRVAEGAEPLRRLCLPDGRAGPHAFPRLRPVEPGAHTSSNRRWGTGSSGVWGKARGRAASRVPSSNTFHRLPARSVSPHGCVRCFSLSLAPICEKQRTQGLDWFRG